MMGENAVPIKTTKREDVMRETIERAVACAAIAAALAQRTRAITLLTGLLAQSPRFDPLQSRRAVALLASLRPAR